MSKQRASFPWIQVIIFFCLLGSIWSQETQLGWFDITVYWLLMVLLIPIALLILCPPFVLRRLGNVAGYVKRAFEQHRLEPEGREHKFVQPYEQGYQAYSSHPVQEPLASPDPYELPQAQYPQQQPPM